MNKRKWMIGILWIVYLLLQVPKNDGWQNSNLWCSTFFAPTYLQYQMETNTGNEWNRETFLKHIWYACCPYGAYMKIKGIKEPIVESGNLQEVILQLEQDGEEIILEGMEEENQIEKVSEQASEEESQDEEVENAEVAAEQAGREGVENQLFALLKEESVQQTFSKSIFADKNVLKKKFYTVDPTTEIADEMLSAARLYERSMKITKDEEPQILIYHTHSQEGFVDSIPGNLQTTVVGVGEFLAQILREQYGYQVIHHCGTYDVESRDYAYANAAPAIEALLEEYPSIEVVIDLHRDAVPEDCKLVTNINGIDVAQFMFFNGLSYTKKLGEITYLNNPYIEENLAFSFQMETTAESYYPGITRKIYLKGYRYNMHFRGKSLLVEMGAQTNTLQEIMNACIPLAHVLDEVLSGNTVALQDS